MIPGRTRRRLGVLGIAWLAGMAALTANGAAVATTPPPDRPALRADAAAPGAAVQVTFVELGSKRCVPCKMMQPVMDAVEAEFAPRVRVVFHDVWTPEGRPFAEQYRIRAIPTQVFLDQAGKEFARHTGFLPKAEIVKILKSRGVE